ncbi:terpene synthase family protein [Microbispora sp. H10670]|uniref:terpene synthase family protein n=1 Tax=Microbispora sp. H10670 TaxID=2729108 RepID=UPI0016045A22|nr:terpene synthase family protein [Microbispora sp. H10670]
MSTAPRPDAGQRASAVASGRTCALAARCQRDLQECAAAFPELFAARPFDATLYASVSLANAFGSPDATAERLRIANRTSLWIFAADWLIDHEATSRTEIDDIVRGALAVADDRAPDPDTPLTRFLAVIRDELAGSPLFPPLRAAWRDELERMLTAMAREWDWKHQVSGGDSMPSFEQYLGNAGNFGSTFVNVSHWIHAGDPGVVPRLDELTEASDAVQRVLRLLNDLATYERDVTWGDLNALLLGVTRDEVVAHIGILTKDCRERLRSLRSGRPDESAYLERQIGYSTGFYGLADYWGEL